MLTPRVERPPEGLARGLVPTSGWVVIAVAVAVVLLAVLAIVFGVIRRRKRA